MPVSATAGRGARRGSARADAAGCGVAVHEEADGATERLLELVRAGSDPHSTRVELRYAVDRPPVVTIRRYRRTAAGWEERSYLALRNTELLPVVTALVTALDRMREHERRQRLHPEDVARFIATRRPRQDAPPLPQFARGAPPGAG